ncbi:MAG: hypothetical protein E7Z90_07365 [Cyanobacteria bacterium SIG29]|nr:hypothetical protein [Cyanobacteria bacterium SIG29]
MNISPISFGNNNRVKAPVVSSDFNKQLDKITQEICSASCEEMPEKIKSAIDFGADPLCAYCAANMALNSRGKVEEIRNLLNPNYSIDSYLQKK